MNLSLMRYNTHHHRYALTLPPAVEADPVAYAMWGHLLQGADFRGPVGPTDNKKNRAVLRALASAHGVALTIQVVAL